MFHRWSVLFCLSDWPLDTIVFALRNKLASGHASDAFELRNKVTSGRASNALEFRNMRQAAESDENNDFRDAISEMAWSFVVNPTIKLRCFSGTVLALLAESSGWEMNFLVQT
jgi:hypothetical protein